MTYICFFKKNNRFVGLEVKGHTGKDVFGQDILCAQISTVSQMLVLAFQEMEKVATFCEISDGYLKIIISEKASQDEKYQFLFRTCFQSMKSIVVDEKKYAKLEVKNV